MNSSNLAAPPRSVPSDTTVKRAPRPVLRWLKNIDWLVVAGRIAVFVFAIFLWQQTVDRGWILRLYIATPRETLDRAIDLIGESVFWTNVRVTLQEAIGGWLLGSSFGLVAGLVLGRWRRLARVFDPYLTFLNATPKIALAPFFILWFGIGLGSKIVLSATIVFFIVQVATQAAVSLVAPDLDLVATTMGATELQKFLKVVLPGIMAPVFGSLRLALVYSLLAAVLGEFIASRSGLGQQLITATNQFDMPTAFVVLIVLALLAVVVNSVLAIAERRLLRWQSADVRGRTISL